MTLRDAESAAIDETLRTALRRAVEREAPSAQVRDHLLRAAAKQRLQSLGMKDDAIGSRAAGRWSGAQFGMRHDAIVQTGCEISAMMWTVEAALLQLRVVG